MGKLFDLVLHPDELAAAVNVSVLTDRKYFRQPKFPRNPSNERADLRRCYELLKLTSRSFAAVILELHPELRDTIMLFYVILRGLDTIEDDMTLSNEVKIPLLRTFKTKVLVSDTWTFNDSGPNEADRIVLVEFDAVLREFHRLKPAYQDVVADITHKMGNGMADYVVAEQQKNYDGVKTIQDYDRYCHYVAGLVGEGVTRLALLSKFGTPVLEEKPQLMESMGQFLQKTNIIRDFREDLDDGRSFWPREVWGKYAQQLIDFTDPKNEDQGLNCVSELACLSLKHVTELLEYLNNVNEPTLFSFCSIPQVMSIATLELVFNNPKLFHEHVKIRRGLAAKLIQQSGTMEGVYAIFREYVHKLHLRNRPQDPNFMRIEVLCGKIEQYIDQNSELTPAKPPPLDKEAIARKEQRFAEIMVVVAGFSGLVFCGLIMTFFAWMLGARFDLLLLQLKDGVHELLG